MAAYTPIIELQGKRRCSVCTKSRHPSFYYYGKVRCWECEHNRQRRSVRIQNFLTAAMILFFTIAGFIVAINS